MQYYKIMFHHGHRKSQSLTDCVVLLILFFNNVKRYSTGYCTVDLVIFAFLRFREFVSWILFTRS